MKRSGLIVRSAISLNLDKLGYLGTAHLLIRTKQGIDSVNLIEQLSSTQNVIIATRTTGPYDLYTVIAFRDMKELFNSILKLKGMRDILTIDLSFGIPGLKNFPPKQVRISLAENEV